MRVLESDFQLTLANPYVIKQLPGRKSDVKDAKWLAECLQKEMVLGSYVPDDDVQQMRQYSHRYRYLSKNIVRVEQRMDNHLQRCNIRFSNYVSNQGSNVSMRKVIKAIIKGERDPVKLCGLVHGRIKNRQGAGIIAVSFGSDHRRRCRNAQAVYRRTGIIGEAAATMYQTFRRIGTEVVCRANHFAVYHTGHSKTKRHVYSCRIGR